MTRTFDRWVDIKTASDYTLTRELEMTMEDLAYDLKVCGSGYPSPRRQTIRDIIVEQEWRKVLRGAVLR